MPGNLVTSTSYQARLTANREAIMGLPGVTPIRWDFEYYRRPYFYAADGWKHPRLDGPDADKRADGYQRLVDMIVEAVT